MAKVRLLSHLKDTCGTGELEIDAGTVKQLTLELERRFGTPFSAKLRSCKIIVNGSNVVSLNLGKTAVGPDDVVSFLPPIAGG